MNTKEIIKELQSQASEKYKANVVKMGIPAEHCIGVSTGEVRNIAKKQVNLMSWHLNYGIPVIMKQCF